MAAGSYPNYDDLGRLVHGVDRCVVDLQCPVVVEEQLGPVSIIFGQPLGEPSDRPALVIEAPSGRDQPPGSSLHRARMRGAHELEMVVQGSRVGERASDTCRRSDPQAGKVGSRRDGDRWPL